VIYDLQPMVRRTAIVVVLIVLAIAGVVVWLAYS